MFLGKVFIEYYSSLCMAYGLLIGIAVVVVLVYVAIKVISAKQQAAVKLFIVLFLLLAGTMAYVYIKYDVNFTTFEGFVQAMKIYFSWLGNAYHNLVKVTGYAINQNWTTNSSIWG